MTRLKTSTTSCNTNFSGPICNNIQIWSAAQCHGVIYCTVVTSYCPRQKLLFKLSYFPRAFRSEGNMFFFYFSVQTQKSAIQYDVKNALFTFIFGAVGAQKTQYAIIVSVVVNTLFQVLRSKARIWTSRPDTETKT